MKFKFIFSFIIILFAALFISCSDEPSSLGIELIGSENISANIFDTNVDSSTQTSSYFKKVVALGNTDWLLVGKYEDIKASALLKFVIGLPDSLKTALIDGDINVIDSWINLTTALHWRRCYQRRSPHAGP